MEDRYPEILILLFSEHADDKVERKPSLAWVTMRACRAMMKKRPVALSTSTERKVSIQITTSKTSKLHLLVSEKVCSEATEIFKDTVEEFCSIDDILRRFMDWRKAYKDSFDQAYIVYCLPKLLAPLIQWRMFSWNPLEVTKVSCIVFVIAVSSAAFLHFRLGHLRWSQWIGTCRWKTLSSLKRMLTALTTISNWFIQS